MISCIITAYKEPATIAKAIYKMIGACQKAGVSYELIIVAPDKETIDIAKEIAFKQKGIKVFQDPGKGKPTALNLAFEKARGDILILSDGDVFICKYAIRELLKRMQNNNIGAVSGHPISFGGRKKMYDYWASLLTDMANITRINANGNFVCSGYLYAIRSKIINQIPLTCLSDDAFCSYKILDAGYKIDYAPNAKVFVKYPDNFKEWFMQKKRSTGGYVQLTEEYHMKPRKEMRSLLQELKGLWNVIAYAKTPQELFWTILLIKARAWLWLNIFWERKIIHKDFTKTWVRIGSTK